MLFLTEEGSILGLLTYMLYGDLLEIVSLNSLMWTRWGFTRGGGFVLRRRVSHGNWHSWPLSFINSPAHETSRKQVFCRLLLK